MALRPPGKNTIYIYEDFQDIHWFTIVHFGKNIRKIVSSFRKTLLKGNKQLQKKLGLYVTLCVMFELRAQNRT